MPQTRARPEVRKVLDPDTPVPELALLGNDRYTVMLTGAGSGVSRHGAIAISRWRNDATRDAHGQWCYLMNVRTREKWSAGHQPLPSRHTSYEASLSGDTADIRRTDGAFVTDTVIAVLADGSGEVRRVSVTNGSRDDAELELTSYQEAVLASPVLDRGHRAFFNLFVQTEWLPESSAILAMRRPRSAIDKPAWCGHVVAAPGATMVSCETDRARFIGRGRSPRNPVAMDNPGEMSGSSGAVLDPVLALRVRVLVAAGQTATVTFATFVAEDREDALERARRFSDPAAVEAAMQTAVSAGDTAARELGIDAGEAAEFQRLASDLLFDTETLSSGTRDDLLEIGLNGEAPIVLASVGHGQDGDRVKRLFDLHEYWRRKGVACDMVILCESPDGERSIRETGGARAGSQLDQPHGIFIRSGLDSDDIDLLESVARVRLD